MRPVHLTIVLAISLVCIQCEIFLDDPPSCSGAVAHFYSIGCGIGTSSEDIVPEEVIEEWLCITVKNNAKATGCDEEYYDMISCYSDMPQGQCWWCDELSEIYFQCESASGEEATYE
jgi:hypothetical protein